jgi:hypothetical protein
MWIKDLIGNLFDFDPLGAGSNLLSGLNLRLMVKEVADNLAKVGTFFAKGVKTLKVNQKKEVAKLVAQGK